jgi:hypothetical protein
LTGKFHRRRTGPETETTIRFGWSIIQYCSKFCCLERRARFDLIPTRLHRRAETVRVGSGWRQPRAEAAGRHQPKVTRDTAQGTTPALPCLRPFSSRSPPRLPRLDPLPPTSCLPFLPPPSLLRPPARAHPSSASPSAPDDRRADQRRGNPAGRNARAKAPAPVLRWRRPGPTPRPGPSYRRGTQRQRQRPRDAQRSRPRAGQGGAPRRRW